MADQNSTRSTLEPFNWLHEQARREPGADLVSETMDVARGIACALELVNTSILADVDEDWPTLDLNQREALLRLAIVSARMLSAQADREIDRRNREALAKRDNGVSLLDVA